MKLIAIVATVAGLAACTAAESAQNSKAASTQDTSAPAQQQTRLSAGDSAILARADKARIQGDAAATLFIIEISDFQCPYCKMWHDSTYAAIKKEFLAKGLVRMAYVNMPLEMHANARVAAQAAMCGAVQDKFWGMHDMLFDKQKDWEKLADPAAKFESYARAVGVNVAEWKACYGGSLMQRLIEGDRQRALTAGVGSTPTFFVGNEVIRGAAPIKDFRAIIQNALAAAKK